jgi:hypothetical protein
LEKKTKTKTNPTRGLPKGYLRQQTAEGRDAPPPLPPLFSRRQPVLKQAHFAYSQYDDSDGSHEIARLVAVTLPDGTRTQPTDEHRKWLLNTTLHLQTTNSVERGTPPEFYEVGTLYPDTGLFLEAGWDGEEATLDFEEKTLNGTPVRRALRRLPGFYEETDCGNTPRSVRKLDDFCSFPATLVADGSGSNFVVVEFGGEELVLALRTD